MKRNRKRHTGCLVSLCIAVIVVAGILLGGRIIFDSIKVEAAKLIAKKAITQQLEQSGIALDETNISAVIDDMPDEDVEQITDIVDKYVGLENVGDYIDMARNGDVAELEQYFMENVSATDQEKLQSLYEKYKDKLAY